MKKLLLIVFISFLFTQNSNAQCDPVLTINENFGFGLPACWTQPNGNYVIDNNNGTFGGHPTYGAIIQLREVANLEGTLVLQVRTHLNSASSFTVERLQNGAIVSSQTINTTPSWQNATLNFTGFPGRGYIRIRQYTSNAPAIRLANVSYTSTCPTVPEIVFKTTDKTIQLDASGNATITTEQVDLGSITTCGDPISINNLSLDVSSFTCTDLGSNIVTLSAEDGSGNVIGTTPITITVEDINAPTVIGQNIAIQTDGAGNATITPAMVDDGSFDGCGGALTLSLSKTEFYCFDNGDVTITLTAEDLSGNTASTDVTVTVTSSIINNQALTATNDAFCPDGSTTYPAATISTASSQVGFDYVLRKSSDNTIIDGPTAGTGSALDFNTGGLTETTNFNVFAEYAGAATNTALRFDGTNDYVATNLNASFDYENGYTFESWINVAVPVGGNWPIFSIGNSTKSDIEVYIQAGTNKLIVTHDRGDAATFGGFSYTIPPNSQWFHLAVTYDGTSAIKTYFNGVEQSITDASFAPAGSLVKTAGMTMKIGKVDNTAFGAGGSVFQGQLDEIRIWTTARTPGDILADKDNCLVGTETDLEYYFPLDNNGGITASELVNGTDGTLTNMDAGTERVASGNGLSCAKYTNSCGFQMLSEIKIGDATGPTATAQNISIQIDAGSGVATITPAMIDDGSSDNCTGGVTLSLSETEFDCSNIGVNAVTLIVEDAAGNQSTVNATVTVSSGINDEIVAANAANFCAGGGSVDVTTGSSVSGVDYYLRDNSDNTIMDGPIAGTGSALILNSGNLTQTTTFNVYGEFVASAPHSGLDFDGVNDKVVTSYIPPATNTLTVELWMFPRSGSFSRILSSYQGSSSVLGGEIVLDTYDASYNNGKGLRFFVSGAGDVGHNLSIPNLLTLNAWNHVAVTFKYGVIKIYVNGILKGTSASAPFASLPLSSSTVTIGEDRIQGPNAEYFDGQMDEIRIWNTARVASEITATMNSCLTGTESGLELYYNFNENTGLTTADLKGSNDGTLTNMDGASDWVSSGVSMSCGQICGLEMTNTVTVSVGDAINPTAVAQDITVQLNSDGGATITASDINNGSSDNCTVDGNLVFSLDKIVFSCADLGANTVTLTVEDASTNNSTATATVTVVDGVAPNAVAQDITVQLNASGNASITVGDTNNNSADNCTATNSLVLSLDKTTFTCADLGANTVTLTVEDASGNQGTATASATVVDGIVPTPVSKNITVQLDATGNVSIDGSDVNDGSSDNCTSGASLIFSLSKSSFSCADLGANNITLTVEDASGNQFSTGATVTIEDNLAPIAIARDITVNLDNAGNATITTTQVNNGSSDNCTSSESLIFSLDITSFTIANLGANTVVLSVEDAQGYVSTASATITIEEKTIQTITFGSLADKAYGDVDFDLTASSDSGLPVSYTVISGAAIVTGSSVSITGVGSVIIEAAQSGDATFGVAAAVQQSLTVNQATLTVSANDQTIVYGDAIPELTFSYSGFVKEESSIVLTTLPTIATTATSSNDVGSYDVTMSGGTADNYIFTLVNGTLTINKADQMISPGAISDKFIDDTAFDITATTTSSLALSYAIQSGPATISGTTVTLNGSVGTVVVEISQAGNVNYNAASTAVSFEVTDPSLQNQTITFDALSGKVYGDVEFALSASTSSELAVNYSVVSGSATVSDNMVSITGVGEVVIEASQAGSDSFNPATAVQQSFMIEKAALTVTADDHTITIGDAIPILSFTYSGFVNSESSSDLTTAPAIATTASVSSEVGSYDITLSGASADHYSISLVNGTLTISEVLALGLDSTMEISVYPNPAVNTLHIDFANFINGKAMLFNVQGLKVASYELLSSKKEIDISSLPNGVYLMVIQNAESSIISRKKLMIRR